MIMQDNDANSTSDNKLPPIEGELLTDEDLKHVSGGNKPFLENGVISLPTGKTVTPPDPAAAALLENFPFQNPPRP
jgi:hypothetical protein